LGSVDDAGAAFAETDAGESVAAAVRRQRDLVSRFQEQAGLARRKFDGPRAAAREFEQAAVAVVVRGRYGARAEQVAGAQVAAAQRISTYEVYRNVCHHTSP
jgi:hypothetical protein